VLLDSDVDAEAKGYHFSLCHDCGVAYARRRPAGPRYTYLLERFELMLGRVQDGIPTPGNPALSSATLSDDDRRDPMPAEERQRRIAAYRNARDWAILKLADHLRSRFAGEWDAVVERAFASGRANFDERGKLRLVKTRRDEAV
jgi:hypothetical protein